jgi:hypothetical protein
MGREPPRLPIPPILRYHIDSHKNIREPYPSEGLDK